MARIISAIFDHHADAERAVEWLRERQVSHDAISLIARHTGTTGDRLPDPGSPDGERSAADGAGEMAGGLATGAGVGAGVGAIFGLAALLIPGVGPLIAAGPLAALFGAGVGTVAAGAVVGGAAGGLAGALGHWGLSEAEAHHYAGEVERGGTYLGVDLDRTTLDQTEAMEAFRRYNGRVQGIGSMGDGTGTYAEADRTYSSAPVSDIATPYSGAGTPAVGGTTTYGTSMADTDLDVDETDRLTTASRRDPL